MDTTLHVALSLARAMQLELDLTANNIANAGTAGFKAERLTLETHQLPPGDSARKDPINFLTQGGSRLDRAQGGIEATGNPFDVALVGDGWLAYQTPEGTTAYGRDGRFVLTPDGQLMTTQGALVLSDGGAPIVLGIEARDGLVIAGDGTLSGPDGQPLGRIGIFSIPGSEGFTRVGPGMFAPPPGVAPLAAGPEAGSLMQGHIERANVEPVREMTRMMAVQQAYDQASRVMSDVDDLRKTFLQRIGRIA